MLQLLDVRLEILKSVRLDREFERYAAEAVSLVLMKAQVLAAKACCLPAGGAVHATIDSGTQTDNDWSAQCSEPSIKKTKKGKKSACQGQEEDEEAAHTQLAAVTEKKSKLENGKSKGDCKEQSKATVVKEERQGGEEAKKSKQVGQKKQMKPVGGAPPHSSFEKNYGNDNEEREMALYPETIAKSTKKPSATKASKKQQESWCVDNENAPSAPIDSELQSGILAFKNTTKDHLGAKKSQKLLSLCSEKAPESSCTAEHTSVAEKKPENDFFATTKDGTKFKNKEDKEHFSAGGEEGQRCTNDAVAKAASEGGEPKPTKKKESRSCEEKGKEDMQVDNQAPASKEEVKPKNKKLSHKREGTPSEDVLSTTEEADLTPTKKKSKKHSRLEEETPGEDDALQQVSAKEAAPKPSKKKSKKHSRLEEETPGDDDALPLPTVDTAEPKPSKKKSKKHSRLEVETAGEDDAELAAAKATDPKLTKKKSKKCSYNRNEAKHVIGDDEAPADSELKPNKNKNSSRYQQEDPGYEIQCCNEAPATSVVADELKLTLKDRKRFSKS